MIPQNLQGRPGITKGLDATVNNGTICAIESGPFDGKFEVL
jgi:hypothetical protein